ncbi:hypothetical protein RFI_07269 [Reticulomyxa filosa]|uniref:Uncharacterized protein n=1 Tax=Reticulomyxa filosa TaxID=46433 RepID=X6NVL5_RETFI|nr:hypothetical protein RFI_07269 [Reticulomyxa filosa]|eukprot:ETO29849.1 hypothetical protein RFI_07269 [Reticulomyxa filosa]
MEVFDEGEMYWEAAEDYEADWLDLEKSEIEFLMEEEGTTLEDVLDCDELLGHCSNKYEALIKFLCEETNLINRKKKKEEEEQNASNDQAEHEKAEVVQGGVETIEKRKSKDTREPRSSKTKIKSSDAKLSSLMWNLFHQPLPPSPSIPDSFTNDTAFDYSDAGIVSHGNVSSALVSYTKKREEGGGGDHFFFLLKFFLDLFSIPQSVEQKKELSQSNDEPNPNPNPNLNPNLNPNPNPNSESLRSSGPDSDSFLSTFQSSKLYAIL